MLIIIFLLINLTKPDLVALKQWPANSAHTDIVISVNIYNDNTKFVSGSNDQTVKIWSMQDYSLLHTETFSSLVTHISLHPVDNRIFILIFDGTIKVLDPNSYLALHTGAYPGGGNGNFLRFFAANSKYIIGGYDTTVPVFHIYSTTTYTAVAGGATTIFTSGDEVTVTSVSRDGTLLAAISSQSTTPIHTLLYNLSTNSLTKTFLDNSALQKWILFNPYTDQLYTTSNDKTLSAYKPNLFTSQYSHTYTYSTLAWGYPNCLNANIKGQLIFSANQYIIFINVTGEYPELMFERADQADVFVFDVSGDGRFLLTGMRNGEITLWQVGGTLTAKDEDVRLLIILGAAILGFVLLLVAVVVGYRCCCAKKDAAVLDTSYELQKNQRKRANMKTENSLADSNHDGSLGLR